VAVRRCFGDGDPLYERYHDEEWGRPVTTERGIYERLCLEACQSGISWLIVLRKRPMLRKAFAGFNPKRVAQFDEHDVIQLLGDPGIIRNRAKIEATITNARATISLRSTGVRLHELVWSFAPTRRQAPKSIEEMPPLTEGSTALAKELKRNGFRFIGPTTAYATMQAIGVVNDHIVGCPVRRAVESERKEALAKVSRAR
jgi:DNA-3-methyladenine glycosylase I